LSQQAKAPAESTAGAFVLASSPSPSLLRKSTSPKGRGLGITMKSALTAKGSHFGGAGASAPERARPLSIFRTIVRKQPRDAAQGCDAHQREHDARPDGCAAAQQPAHKIELEQPHKAPVDAAHDH